MEPTMTAHTASCGHEDEYEPTAETKAGRLAQIAAVLLEACEPCVAVDADIEAGAYKTARIRLAAFPFDHPDLRLSQGHWICDRHPKDCPSA
jgi:hypothetical protein